MLMSSWTPQVLYFMEAASRHSGYFKSLAAIVREHLPLGGTLCDAGSGMGQLTVELSPWARRIDAVDRSLNATSYVSGRLALLGIGNVAPINADLFEHHPDEPYDLMVFSLSLSMDDAIRAAQGKCKRRILVINKVHSRMEADRSREDDGVQSQTATRKQRPLVYDFDACLVALQARYGDCEGQQVSLCFDQPFKSLDEAHLFFRLFRDRSYPHGLSDFQLLRLLEKGTDPQYPFFLPITRHLAVFVCRI